MKKLLLIFIYSFLSFEVMSFDNLIGKNLICEGKYQVFGYEFLNNNEVIRHASSNSESDYYKNNGLYEITQKFIKLDVEGDIFTREILRKTLELFIKNTNCLQSLKDQVCNTEPGNSNINIVLNMNNRDVKVILNENIKINDNFINNLSKIPFLENIILK